MKIGRHGKEYTKHLNRGIEEGYAMANEWVPGDGEDMDDMRDDALYLLKTAVEDIGFSRNLRVAFEDIGVELGKLMRTYE